MSHFRQTLRCVIFRSRLAPTSLIRTHITMFALAIVVTNCSEIIKDFCILHRQTYSLSKYCWVKLLRSPFGLPLVWRCVRHRISYSSSCRVAVFSLAAPPIPGRKNLLLPNGFWHEHVAFRNDAKVVNWSVLLFSLNPSISTPGRTAGHPCVVPMELACSFYRNVCVLLNLSEC